MSKKNKIRAKNLPSGNAQPPPPSKETNPLQENKFLVFILKPQNFFAIAAFVFGGCFMVTTPPFQVADEITHFDRVFMLSEFKTLQKTEDSISGDYVPKSIDSVFLQFRYLCWQPHKKVKGQQIKDALKIQLEKDKVKFTRIDAGPYFYFSYLPHIPAVWLGKLMGLSPGYILYLGRLFGLLFYAFCVWYALRTIPIGKYLMLSISLLPMCLAQASSWNADCVLFSLTFLVISLILKISFIKERFKLNKDFILTVLILSIMGLFKPVYIPIAFLIFLIPKLYFNNTYRYLAVTLSTILVSILLTLAWRKILGSESLGTGISQNSPKKIEALLQNPMLFTDVLGETFRVFKKMYYQSTIGILGYLDTLLPKGVYSSFTFLVFFLTLFEADKNFKLRMYQRLTLLIVSIGVFLITILAMYLMTRPEAGLVVEGVQGRYFIPVVFPFFLAFYGLIPLKLNFASNKYLVFILYFILIVLLFKTESTLVNRYFS